MGNSSLDEFEREVRVRLSSALDSVPVPALSVVVRKGRAHAKADPLNQRRRGALGGGPSLLGLPAAGFLRRSPGYALSGPVSGVLAPTQYRRRQILLILAALVASLAVLIANPTGFRAVAPSQPTLERPQIGMALDKTPVTSTEVVRGTVVVTAGTATQVTAPVEMRMFPVGVSPSPGSELALLVLAPGGRALTAHEVWRLPFSWDQRGQSGALVPAGDYVLSVTTKTDTTGAGEHLFATIGGVIGVTLLR
jgi:hypothetical protein